MLLRLTKSGLIFLLMATSVARGQRTGADRAEVDEVVRRSFQAVHAGWSSDEVLLQDDLCAAFLAACKKEIPQTPEVELGWTLLKLRKVGQLQTATTRRTNTRHAAYQHVAEMAARWMEDKHKANMDRVVCDPQLRGEFDTIAKRLAPDVDAYLIRKAAFGLRKARRLQPELVTRVADWDREISVWSLAALRDKMSDVPDHPGVYIFRDQSGYLYIGESKNLRRRLETHVDQDDPTSLVRLWSADESVGLADVEVELHSFDPESRAKETRVRRAYESQLIDSRQPRFNIRP